MEIARMEVIPVAHREPPLRNSWGAHSDPAARTIIRLTTRNGLIGVSETYGDRDVIAGLEDARPLVEGRSPYERLPLKLRLQNDMVYGAIEVALFDLIGRSTGQSVATLLGGTLRDSVEFSAYLFYKYQDEEPSTAAIAPEEATSPKAMVAQAREFVDRHGFEVLKLKGGVLEPEVELETLRQLAVEFGSEMPLRIDPNGAWSVETTIHIAQRLRELPGRIEFLEDPVPSMHAHSRLKRHVDYPIATNMFVTSFDDVMPAMDPPSVDIILSDHHYWGGLEGNRRLDDTVRTLDLGIGMHSNSHLGVSMAAMVQSAAAMPSLRYACDTHYPWMADDVVADPLTFEDGAISVPTGPGLGVELDESELERLHQRYQEHDTLGYSSVGSMASAYADAMAEREDDWVPDKPIW